MTTSPKKRSSLNMGMIVIGSELAGSTITGVILDVVFETKGLFTAIFAAVGMTSAAVLGWWLLRQENASS
jgi:F0F1-type ATP synthase assembly protein I